MQERKKRGQEHHEVVLWTIGLAGLLVFGVFIYQLYAKTPAILDKEACKESVVKRGLWGINQLPDDVKPELQCKTQPIGVKTTNEEEIKKTVANAMYDCWDMLGRGKVDFLDTGESFGLSNAKSSCLICSTIKFSGAIQKSPKTISLGSYLKETKIPQKKITYLEYFTDQEGADISSGFQISPIRTDQDYAVVFFRFESQDAWNLLAKDVGAVGGTFFLGSKVPGGKAVGGAIGSIMKTPAGAIVTLVSLLGVIGYQAYNAETDQVFAAGYCNGNEAGCSQVILTTYNAQTLGELCGSLESLP
ncbi:MAG TPA: hypothetical protein HA282_05575 [Nanoarchaeota archaeon]|nr:MAG: hypothetical protein QT01_C0001G0113 [archaeon GW2011_AR6]MBS3082555.1 hypothetical protein [Candidatus Pacearchaeota archaeon]HIH17484.1 hypothetical protein [Nanoarchaeota archaeon]HIH33933.1 hypothetical protein [Nanoarchaeota archaeon]HIH51776.1 hypothetical protein [Nanoarchaeota archaeon]